MDIRAICTGGRIGGQSMGRFFRAEKSGAVSHRGGEDTVRVFLRPNGVPANTDVLGIPRNTFFKASS